MVTIRKATNSRIDRAVIQHGEAINNAHRTDAEGTPERAILDYGFAEGAAFVHGVLMDYLGDCERPPDGWEALGEVEYQMALHLQGE